jgi:hypothetical protein
MAVESELPTTHSPSAFVPAPSAPLWLRILGFPRSPSGWWSVILEVGFIILITLLKVLIASGQRGGETFFANPLMAGTLIAASASAIAGSIFGLFSFIRRRERSLLVFIAVLLGLFVLMFTIVELGGHD